MPFEKIPIQLEVEAARIYRTASPQDQVKMGILLSLLMRNTLQASRSLNDIMDEISAHAASKGLTEDTLKSILSK